MTYSIYHTLFYMTLITIYTRIHTFQMPLNHDNSLVRIAGGEDAILQYAQHIEGPQTPTFRTSTSSDSFATSTNSSRVRKPRKPRKGNEIVPSVFRPHVLASDRVLLWTTPHTYTFSEAIARALPSSPLTRLFEVMAHSLDEGTRNGYGAGLLRFTQFCDLHKVPEAERMPASEVLLSAFAASAGGITTESCLNNWMAALHYWHTINGATWNGRDMLHQTRQGVKKLVPISAKRAKRPPVTMDHLLSLRNGLDLTDAFDIAVWAIACVSFWSCCRLGELTIPSVNGFDFNKHVSRTAGLRFAKTPEGVEYATLHIPYSKTTQNLGADISITARPGDPTCPISALRHHMKANTDIPPRAPFFSYETEEGLYSPITKGWFMARCNAVWIACGLPEMPGHSFRIGGATYLLLLGTPPDMVAVQGRWKSRAFLEYWRDIDSILPLFLSTSSSIVIGQHSRIREAMEAYKKKFNLR